MRAIAFVEGWSKDGRWDFPPALFLCETRGRKFSNQLKRRRAALMSEHWVADDRPTWAEIDLDALAWNYRAVRERVDKGVSDGRREGGRVRTRRATLRAQACAGRRG